jgi:hypothetical protein
MLGSCLTDLAMMVKTLWWHMQVNPTVKQMQDTTYMKGIVLLLFGQFHHSNFIFMIIHSHCLRVI